MLEGKKEGGRKGQKAGRREGGVMTEERRERGKERRSDISLAHSLIEANSLR